MLSRRILLFITLAVCSISILACGGVSAEGETPVSSITEDHPTLIPTELLIEPTQAPQDITSSPTVSPITNKPGVPEMVTLGSLGIFGYTELGMLVVQDGQISIADSPVEYMVFWDYSPVSGRLAYSSEFFHGSNTTTGEGIPITDLWVYDYETNQAEKWLTDFVSMAVWAPDGERITAAVFNPGTNQLDLVFVTGPDQVETIAECASTLFSWSPDGDMLAFVNTKTYTRISQNCPGTFLVSFPEGTHSSVVDVQRVSDFGSEELFPNYNEDKPLWALDQNALIFPDTPFWVIPLDGSPPFVPLAVDNVQPQELPQPFLNLWDPDKRLLIGTVNEFMTSAAGVWFFELSQDLRTIVNRYRVGDQPPGSNSDITLIGWWIFGESILVMDRDTFSQVPVINDYWIMPTIWSLEEYDWVDIGS